MFNNLEKEVMRYKLIDRDVFTERLANKCKMDIEDVESILTYSTCSSKKDEIRDDLYGITKVKVYQDTLDSYDIVKLSADGVKNAIKDHYEEDGFSLKGLYMKDEGGRYEYEMTGDVIIKMKRDKFIAPWERKTLTNMSAYAVSLFMLAAPFILLAAL